MYHPIPLFITPLFIWNSARAGPYDTHTSYKLCIPSLVSSYVPLHILYKTGTSPTQDLCVHLAFDGATYQSEKKLDIKCIIT